ncbi:hypothetical protein [Streptomyces kronopolitis]|uniref:hypothetical protein n=1 Tax=Streptomyces kronopolitis TaxID=1612435 RepID=UPI00343CAF63
MGMMTFQATRKPPRAVLYICAQRDGSSSLAAERAIEEGRAFAERNDLRILTEIPDTYGEPVPSKRAGWARVREMAENGEMDVVIARWPNALSVDSELRAPELDYLGQHGVQVLFSWAPLAAMDTAGTPQ